MIACGRSIPAMLADPTAVVRAFLRPRLFPAARLCLGYSGGLDSSVLLHVLARLRAELGFHLTAVHVHHGLSGHADDWAEFCRRACACLAVPLAVRRVTVVNAGDGIEAAARRARYRVYAEQAADFLLLAHQQDDQAETLLLRLLRGAGVRGLAAMAAERPLVGGRTRLLRPLLSVARRQLEDYAAANQIAALQDESNMDVTYRRNWLRQQVLPLIETRQPAIRQLLARSAEQLAESAGLLDDLARLDLGQADVGDGLPLHLLAESSGARARNLLRYWLRRQTGVSPSSAKLDDMLHQWRDARPDRHPVVAWAGGVLRRRDGCVLWMAPPPPAPVGVWVWHGERELILAGYGCLHFTPSLGEGLRAAALSVAGGTVGWRRGGERLQPECRRPNRCLKDLLRESGVPAEQRFHLPLLWLADRLVWVAGIGVDCAFQAAPEEPGWLISWRPKESPGG